MDKGKSSIKARGRKSARERGRKRADLQSQALILEDANDGSVAPSLRFLTFNHPSQAKGSRSRRTVRSHVTKLQHRKAWGGQLLKTESPGSGYSSPSEGSPISNCSKSTYPAIVQAADVKPTRPEAPQPSALTFTRRASRHRSMRDEIDTLSIPFIPQQIALARADPFRPYDPPSDWNVDISSLMDQYFEKACTWISSQGAPEMARELVAISYKSQMFQDGFLFNALTTLTTTSVPAAGEKRPHYAMVMWLRSNFLLAIQTIVRSPESYDSRALAFGIALLIGWELEVGETHACEVHLRALPNIISSEFHTTRQDHCYIYGDEAAEAFRGGRELPAGFEYYRSQNLLPPALMFYVGSLAYFDSSAPGANRWLREIWACIGACAPGPTAQAAVLQGTLDARVAQLVRQAGIMVGGCMRASSRVRPVAQLMLTGRQAQWYWLLEIDWDSLTGTVYDRILLWCLCIFCASTSHNNNAQLKAISDLLKGLDIHNVQDLLALLGTFVVPPCLHEPLQELWSLVQSSFSSARDGPNR